MNQSAYSNSPSGSRSRKSSHSPSPSGPGAKGILLFYVLPFIIINGIIFFLVTAKPKYTVTLGETTDYATTSISLTIKSILPTKNLSVALNAEPLELEKTGSKTYTATVTQNGVVEAYLENFNGMGVSVFEQVNILDDKAPTIEAYSIEDGILKITLSDSQSGIDYSSIHAVDSTGATLPPQSVDKLTATVTFASDPNGLTLFVSDLSGHVTEQPFSITETVEGSGN